MSDITKLAAMIYGEAANQKPEIMRKIGSTAVNRLSAGRDEEFGSNMDEVLNKGYYAVRNPNEPYKHTMTGKFPDELSATQYKQALAIASGLIKGTITPDKGEFYFTKSELNKLKKKGRKAFNFDAVKKLDEFGDYQMFGY